MTKRLILTAFCLIFVLTPAKILFAGTSGDGEFRLNDLVISNVWARATPPNVKTGAVYFTVTNTGPAMDTLTGAKSPIAGKSVIHQTTMTNGVMTMAHAGPAMIMPGGVLELAPGGMHVMLMKLTGKLSDGTVFPMTLTFEKSGHIEVQVTVKR